VLVAAATAPLGVDNGRVALGVVPTLKARGGGGEQHGSCTIGCTAVAHGVALQGARRASQAVREQRAGADSKSGTVWHRI
jgi:hypothetical protein